MRITVTGASGRIGRRSSSGCAPAATRSPSLSRDPTARRGARRARLALGPDAGPRPPARSSGRDAVVHLAGEDVAQRWSDDAKRRIREQPRARHPQPRRRPRAPPTRARACSSRRRPSATTARTATSASTSPRRPATTSSPRCASAWEREAQRGRRARPARGAVRTGVVLDAERRRAGQDAAAVQARRRRPGRGRRAVHAVDPRRRRRRASTSPRSTTTAGPGPVNATAPEPVTNQRVLQGARPRAAPARGRARCPRFAHPRPLRRDGGDRHDGRSAWCPSARARARLRVRATPTSTRRCGRRCAALGRLGGRRLVGRSAASAPWRLVAARAALTLPVRAVASPA